MARARIWIALGLVAGATVGCQKVWGFEEFEAGAAAGAGGGAGSGGASGSGGTSTGGSSGAGGTGGGEPCVHAGAQPDTVGIHVKDGSCVWVDKYEVSRDEYEAFRTKATPGTISGCTWNTSLDKPEKKQGAVPCTGPGELADAGADAGALPGDAPVTCVDWCDAAQFCWYVGKKLCTGTFNQPKEGVWFDACSSNGKNDYPYAGTYQSTICNDDSVTAKTLVGVGSRKQCVTPSGLFDMTGNAAEWVDACNGDTQTDTCDIRGGSFNDNSGLAMCGGSVGVKKEVGLATLGFRCCWTPP